MKNKYFKRILSLILATSMITLTGCNKFIGDDVASYPLVPMLTQQEVIDYYSEAIKYDSVVSRNITVHDTTYVTKDIEGEKAEKLKDLTSQAEVLLGQDTFEVNQENLNIMSEGTFHYMKGVLDNVYLTDGKILNIKGALGYYFVDKQYTIADKQPGNFNKLTSLIGIDGAFIQHYNGEYSVNTAFIKTLVNKLNEHYYNNNIVKCAYFDENSLSLQIVEGEQPDYKNNKIEDLSNLSNITNENTSLDNGTDTTQTEGEIQSEDSTQTENEETPLTLPGDAEEEDAETSEVQTDTEATATTETTETNATEATATTETVEATATTEEAPPAETTQKVETTKKLTYADTVKTVTPAERKIQFDTTEINTVVGGSLKPTAKMPNLDAVYEFPSPEGDISGYGINTEGGNGMKIFGFDRNALSGTITIRYVFKDDSNGTGNIYGYNIYCIEEEIKNGINVATNNVLLPEFLTTELEKMIERADRVTANADISGLITGDVYEDIGYAVLRGYKEQYTRINKYMSTLRQVIARDTSNNAYLVEIETTTIEGARDVDSYGTYRDKYYVVIQQQGNKFKIIDQIRVSRTLTNEPAIDPDSTTQKRLVALNLAGEIPENSKEDITNLMSELYTASTNRLIKGPKDIQVDGQTITLEKGMVDCFQTDVSILSQEKNDYMNSQLRNQLIRHGAETPSVLNGTITSWIGGYENQAEFTTEELITYKGVSGGYYMQVYYLVSKLNDVWVIDERTILDEYDVEADKLETIQERIQ